MKTIKIAFSGMSDKFDPDNNFITNILRKRYIVDISTKPDYLFFSERSKDYLKYKCVRIFYTAENLVPDFNICDYAIGFHYIEFADRFCRFPLYLVDGYTYYNGDNYSQDLLNAMHKHENSEDIVEKKSEFCSFVYSNAEAAKCRAEFFNTLNKYKKVNSGGRYLNNIGEPVNNKLDFQLKHKFAIAFENTSTSGYTTEKIVQAFAANAIPIYWGNPDITREFNPGSFINCHDYGLTEKGEKEAIDQIIEEVMRLDQDNEAYLSVIRTPAFYSNNQVTKMKNEFESFLYNIFDQSYDAVFRRNRYYWGERYERKQKIGNDFYWTCRKIIPIRDFCKKMFGFRLR